MLLAKANSSAVLAIQTTALILLVIGGVFYFAWPHLPLQDSAEYFQFADQRRILGLPHFWNVFSNVLFLYLSLFGFFIFIRNYHALDEGLWESFLVFAIGVFLTCWGSSYFHLNPNPQTLLWDRLPMAVGFVALFCFLFADRITDRYNRVMLPVLATLAIGSVFAVNHGPQDLRPYIVVQYGALLACLFLLVFHRRGRVSTKLFAMSFVFYGIAKLCEYFDVQMFDHTFWSGHTWKHIFAAAAIYCLCLAAAKVHLQIKRDRM